MPVYPLQWHPAGERHSYPHMAKNDAVLWERFLADYAGNFLAFAYDVALGGYLPDEPADDLAVRKMWQYSTACKIDALGERPDDLWIIEVRPHANVASIGSVLCYTLLARADGLETKPIVPCVLTDRCSPDIQYCAEALEITLIQLDVKP